MKSLKTTTFYDGGCPVCMRLFTHYQRLDWARRIRWIDMIDAPEVVESHGLSFAAAMDSLHVLDRDGRLCTGAYAFAALWAELPYYRYLAKLMHLPGILPIADSAYRRLSRGRYQRRCQNGACSSTR